MNFIKNFYYTTVNYDLVNKFSYKKTKQLPKIKKIILNFGYKTNDIKNLASSLLALELITTQRGMLTLTKTSNILLKIRKGNPVGCKVTLRNGNMYNYFSKLVVEIFPKLKNFEGFKKPTKLKKNVFSYEINDIFNFQELEEHYYLFNNLSKLSITIITNTNTSQEFFFLLNALKFPFKKQI
jgi:large subunit ribosomal protein L5